jgi:hypothetical protein
VLGAMHGGGGADHDEPHEEIAWDLVDAVEGVVAREAHDHLREHRDGHHGEDQAAEEPQPLVEAGAPAAERPAAARSRDVGHAGYLMLRM